MGIGDLANDAMALETPSVGGKGEKMTIASAATRTHRRGTIEPHCSDKTANSIRLRTIVEGSIDTN